MAAFVQLTAFTGKPIMINVDRIVGVFPHGIVRGLDGGEHVRAGISTVEDDSGVLYVRESYEEVKEIVARMGHQVEDRSAARLAELALEEMDRKAEQF